MSDELKATLERSIRNIVAKTPRKQLAELSQRIADGGGSPIAELAIAERQKAYKR